jgi:hypothetical protein
MAKRSVSQIVTQGNGFGQIFIQPQSLGHSSGDLRDFKRVGQAGAVVIAKRSHKHLGFVLQSSE